MHLHATPEPNVIIARGIYIMTERFDAHGREDGAELHRIDAESERAIGLNRYQYEGPQERAYFEKR